MCEILIYGGFGFIGELLTYGRFFSHLYIYILFDNNAYLFERLNKLSKWVSLIINRRELLL